LTDPAVSGFNLSMAAGKLPRSFYLRPTLTIARDLLGKLLVRRIRGALLVGRIVEVEAYSDHDDPASHSFRGETERNRVMFAEGGHLYVYFTYGMHFCANIVTGEPGRGCAVLLRALEPLAGIEQMARARGKRSAEREALCSGPAKICQAFRITRRDNGRDLCGEMIWVADPRTREHTMEIGRSSRIGISSGKDRLWRLFLRNSPFLSR
jgi:DNA-3-methyladenine glycosylase